MSRYSILKVIGLKTLSNCTYHVTIPFLNCVERVDQNDFCSITQNLFQELQNNNLICGDLKPFHMDPCHYGKAGTEDYSWQIFNQASVSVSCKWIRASVCSGILVKSRRSRTSNSPSWTGFKTTFKITYKYFIRQPIPCKIWKEVLRLSLHATQTNFLKKNKFVIISCSTKAKNQQKYFHRNN